MPLSTRVFTPIRIVLLVTIFIGAALTWWLFSGPGGVRTDSVLKDGLPQRVVLFSPNLVETACVLGFEDKIVAITDFCRWPESVLDRPRIGGVIDPDLERLALLDPDLLVLQGESPLLRSFAKRSNIPIADVKMDDDVISILAGFLQVDDLLGGPQSGRGEELVDQIQAELGRVMPVTIAERPSVLLVLSRDPASLRQIFTAGGGTFLCDLVETAGGDCWTASQGNGYFEVPLEVLMADPPDVVVELRAASPQDPPKIWTSLPGGGPEVRVLDFDAAMVPGPRIVETATKLRDLLWSREQDSSEANR